MSAGGRTAPAPVPADVGIVAAMGIEVAPLLSLLRGRRKYAVDRHEVHEGELEGRLVVLTITGMGQAAARRGAARLIAGHRPTTVLSAGYAGALDPTLRRGDASCPTEIIDEAGGRIACAPSLAGEPPSELRLGGRLVTVDRILRSAAEKAEVRARTAADLVDMETYAVAALCAERGIRFASLRVVSDEAAEDLPPEILSLVGPTGGYRVGAAIGAILKRPRSLMTMLEMRDRAEDVSRRLAVAVRGLLARMI